MMTPRPLVRGGESFNYIAAGRDISSLLSFRGGAKPLNFIHASKRFNLLVALLHPVS